MVMKAFVITIIAGGMVWATVEHWQLGDRKGTYIAVLCVVVAAVALAWVIVVFMNTGNL